MLSVRMHCSTPAPCLKLAPSRKACMRIAHSAGCQLASRELLCVLACTAIFSSMLPTSVRQLTSNLRAAHAEGGQLGDIADAMSTVA